jgi:MYXO-CTERM domain-containing protein
MSCTSEGCSSGSTQGNCDVGYVVCGNGCMPSGSSCCASQGYEAYCDPGKTCTSQGTCQSGSTTDGVSCSAGKAATVAECGGDTCGCADSCSSGYDCKSGCCSGGYCSPPCVCETGAALHSCGSSSEGSEYDSGGSYDDNEDSDSDTSNRSGCAITMAAPAGSARFGAVVMALLALVFAGRRRARA